MLFIRGTVSGAGSQFEPTSAIAKQLLDGGYGDSHHKPRDAARQTAERGTDHGAHEQIGNWYQHHPREDDGGDSIKQHHSPDAATYLTYLDPNS